VDLDAAEAALSEILPTLNATIPKGALREDIGGFSALLRLGAFSKTPAKTTVVSACTDGVGTKIALLQAVGRNFVAGVDAVAMCVNDLITSGAQPAFFLDYFAASRFDAAIFKEVLSGIAAACKQCACAVVGGETAILPGFFRGKLYDVVGFAVGFASKSSLFRGPSSSRPGDLLIGIPSSGPHSNGFSLIRAILKRREISLDGARPGVDSTLADLLLAPTHLYPPLLARLTERHPRKVIAAAHISGGGIPGNLPRVLPPHLSADLHIPASLILPIFRWLQSEGAVPEEDLWNTFNMGIGFVLITRARSAPPLLADIRKTYPTADVIGRLIPGDLSVSIRLS
jgi:phosphoribosylformylglycinamidine cyclo-ligase